MRRRYGAGCLVLLVVLVGLAYVAHAQRIQNAINAAMVSTAQLMWSTSTAQTIADNGNGGTAATGTITYSTGLHLLTCSDAQGCTMTMSETGASTGLVMVIVNVSANAATFADDSGVLVVPASNCSVAAGGAITLIYANSQWNVLGHSATCS